MASTPEKIRGACNCGAITLSIDASSFPTTAAICHCVNCRASGGSLFSYNLPVPTKAIEIEGKPKVWTEKAENGNTCNRHFCGDCGSPIVSIIDENPENTYVKGGLFRKFGVDLPRPGLQLFMRRRETWEEEIDGATSVD